MAISIRERLTLGSLFLYGLMLFSAVLGIVYLIRVDTDSKAILQDNYDSVSHVQGMLVALDDTVHVDASIVAIDSLVRAQENNITEAGETEVTARLRTHFERWKSTRMEHDAHALRSDLNAILVLNLAAIDRKSALAETSAGHALFWLFVLTILLALVGLGFSVAFPAVVSTPIVRLKEAAQQLAAHNYRHRIPRFGMKELDDLARSFNDMAVELEKYEHTNMDRLMQEKNRAEAVVNSLQDASIGVGPDGKVLFANRRALELFGLSHTNIVGQPIGELAQRNALLRHMIGASNGLPYHQRQDGREEHYIGATATINGTEGALGQVHVVRNITHFQQRDRAKTEFLATISHELKTPLASTDIGLTLLEGKHGASLNEEQRAILADLRKAEPRLERIVGELLDLAQAETGNIRVQLAELPLEQVVNDALAAVKVSAQQKDILFAVRPAEADLRVSADADKAVWVLVNLLSNAVRHSPERGVVSIAMSGAGGQVSLNIADQGPGIPKDEQARLFERFAPGSASHNGTGLGLSIAREFMQAMGGNISLDHNGASGASFTLTFAPAR